MSQENSVNPFSQLPIELYQHIFSSVDLPTLLRSVLRTNTNFYATATQATGIHSFWHCGYEKYPFDYQKVDSEKLSHDYHQNCAKAMKTLYDSISQWNQDEDEIIPIAELKKNFIKLLSYIVENEQEKLKILLESKPALCLTNLTQMYIPTHPMEMPIFGKEFTSKYILTEIIAEIAGENDQALFDLIGNFLEHHAESINSNLTSLPHLLISCHQAEEKVIRAIEKNQSSIDFDDFNDHSIFFLALKHNKKEVVKYCIEEQKMSSNIRIKYSEDDDEYLELDPPIVVATCYGSLEAVKYLIEEKDIPIHTVGVGENRHSILWLAADKGSTQVFYYLIGKGALKYEYNNGLDVLCIAIQNKKFDIARYLLDNLAIKPDQLISYSQKYLDSNDDNIYYEVVHNLIQYFIDFPLFDVDLLSLPFECNLKNMLLKTDYSEKSSLKDFVEFLPVTEETKNTLTTLQKNKQFFLGLGVIYKRLYQIDPILISNLGFDNLLNNIRQNSETPLPVHLAKWKKNSIISKCPIELLEVVDKLEQGWNALENHQNTQTMEVDQVENEEFQEPPTKRQRTKY